jgi:hypothetical protein
MCVGRFLFFYVFFFSLCTFCRYFYQAACWHPIAQPVLATVYFVSFVLLAAFVILSLFIGAVCSGKRRRPPRRRGAHHRIGSTFLTLRRSYRLQADVVTLSEEP